MKKFKSVRSNIGKTVLFGFERIHLSRLFFENYIEEGNERKISQRKISDVLKETQKAKKVKVNQEVKILRAYGGCLGDICRRRTRQAAKSCGEAQIAYDPQISEWSNPAVVMHSHPCHRT